MKKIVRQQNYLKELIESQGNKFLSKNALKSLLRSALEPLLDTPESAVVFYRIEDKKNLTGLIKRLEFSEIESISYNDNSSNLLEKVWAKTEFLCTLTHRYVSIILWDYNTSDKNLIRYYSIYNSKLQKEALDIIKRNSKIDISSYLEKFNPDRRDNDLLNISIRKLIESMDEMTSDAVLGYAEKSAKDFSNKDYYENKSRIIAHEIRNQLSICDLYSEIISRNLKKDLNIDSIKNALISINKAIKMASNSLLMLRTQEKTVLKQIDLQQLVNDAYELSKVYGLSKNISMSIENNENIKINADEEKLMAVLVNLVKNASEAFEDSIGIEDSCNDKYIKFTVIKNEKDVQICISNNAKGIENPEKIFDKGFTTKRNGNGLGLWICRNFIKDQNGTLELLRSTEDYTEFAITLELS